MLVDGRPVHFTYEGDYSSVEKLLPLGQKTVIDCINLNIPKKIITLSQDDQIIVTNLNGIAKLHIKATGSTHGFSFITASEITNSGFGDPINSDNFPWGTVLEYQPNAPYTRGQSSVSRNFKVVNSIQVPNWKTKYHTTYIGGRISTQVIDPTKNSDVYSIKGYDAGWLPKAVHGKESHLGKLAPSDATALQTVCYDMDVISPIYKNGEELELTIKASSDHQEDLLLQSCCGVGVSKINGIQTLVGICITDIAKGIYTTFKSIDFKQVEWTGTFTLKNDINLISYPMVFFFNASCTKASAINHYQLGRTGDTDMVSSTSIECRACHVIFSGGQYTGFSAEAEAPATVTYSINSFDTNDGTETQGTVEAGTIKTTALTCTRTVAIGYHGDIEKRLVLSYTFDETELNKTINEFVLPGLGYCLGRVAPADCASYTPLSRTEVGDYDVYSDNIRINIRYSIKADGAEISSITVFNDTAVSIHNQYSRTHHDKYREGWSSYNGCGPAVWDPTDLANGVYPTATFPTGNEWAEYLIPLLYPDTGVNLGLSSIGGSPPIDAWAVKHIYGPGPSDFEILAGPKALYIIPRPLSAEVSGRLDSKTPYVNLIAVDLINDKLYYDKLEVEAHWPTTGRVSGGYTYDTSSGQIPRRRIYENNTVIFDQVM